MLMPKLPPELIDNIIDFLHDDILSLRSCSLVSFAWVGASRLHLFRHVTLGVNTHVRRQGPSLARLCHRLYEVILASPNVATYVTYIVIYDGIPDSIMNHPSLPLLLRNLTSLLSISIISTTQDTSTDGTVSNDLLSALNSLPSLQECTLRGLRFHHPNDILRMLHSCTAVKSLNLMALSFSSSSNEELDIAEVPTRSGEGVETLFIDNGSLASSFLKSRSPVEVAMLRQLSIKLNRKHYVGLASLLPYAVSLQRLEVQLAPDAVEGPALDLSLTRSLAFLAIDVAALIGRRHPLPWLHAVLASMSPVSSLEELNLTVTVDVPPPTLYLAQYQNFMSGWQRFDTLLTSDQFTSLKRVRIDFLLDNPIEDTIVPTIIDDILAYLRGLDGKGILYVDSCEIR